MKTNNTLILRLEGAALFFFSLFMYHHLGYSWKIFLMLFLLPDVALAGYSFGSKIGAIFYNILHSEVMPVALAAIGFYQNMPKLFPIALVWFCHINFDRLLGIGLKEFKGFKHTHLGQMK